MEEQYVNIRIRFDVFTKLKEMQVKLLKEKRERKTHSEIINEALDCYSEKYLKI